MLVPEVTKRRVAAVVSTLAIGVVGVFMAPAHATQLRNDLNTLACKEYKIADKQKVQACTAVQLGDPDHYGVYGAASITAYKKISTNGLWHWVRDDSVQLRANTVQLFVVGDGKVMEDGEAVTYNGEVGTSTHGGPYYMSRDTDRQVYSKGSLSVLKGGVVTKTINVQSNTGIVPAL